MVNADRPTTLAQYIKDVKRVAYSVSLRNGPQRVVSFVEKDEEEEERW